LVGHLLAEPISYPVFRNLVSAIPSAEMVACGTVALLLFSPDNPDDALVTGVF